MSSNLESKIAEMILGCDDVKEKKCELLKDLNTPHTEKENRKICASCRAKAILALIASEQQEREGELTVAYMMGAEDMKAKNRLLVEALKAVRDSDEYLPKALCVQIDAALAKGGGK